MKSFYGRQGPDARRRSVTNAASLVWWREVSLNSSAFKAHKKLRIVPESVVPYHCESN